MKNILVTGSSGYIGKSFINQYKNEYLFHTFSLQKKSLQECSLKDIDVVLHCAALVHQKEQLSYDKYYDINVVYPFELAKKAKKNGVGEFIFLSTVAVYGDEYEYLSEASATTPKSSYGKSKLEAEKKLLNLSDDSFKVSILRLPMVYGYKAPGNIQSLISLVKKAPLLPLAKIKNRRSFIYIENLTYYIHTIVHKEVSGVFLLCDDYSISTTKLVELIAKALDKQLYLVQIPLFSLLLFRFKKSLYNRLFSSLEINNEQTRKKLFADALKKLPFSVEDGIKRMIKGENL